MVAGDEVRAVPGAQPAQRFGGRGEVGDAAVDQVADDGHQVGVGAVDGLDDAPGVGAAEDRAQVDIADDGDPEAVGGARQFGQGDGDALDRRVRGGCVAVP